MKDDLPPPIADNNDAISVHLSYIRRDILEIKNSQKETNDNIEDIGNNFVPRSEFEELKKISDDHENRTRTIEQSMWKYIGASSVITTTLSVLGSYFINFFFR